MNQLKCNLTIRGNLLNGYMNLDPTSQGQQEPDRILCDPTNLDPLIDHNEAIEFLANDTLDYLPLPARQPTLNHYLCKLAHGGLFIITGLDLHEVCRLVGTGKLLDTLQINSIMYGDKVSKKSAVTMDDTASMIMQTGQYNIEKVSFSNLQWVITARRK